MASLLQLVLMARQKVTAHKRLTSLSELPTYASKVSRLALLAALGCGTLLLLGCASLSKEECSYLDWNLRGGTDGSEGKNMIDQFDIYRQECYRHDVRLNQSDFDEYKVGHEAGQDVYCTPRNGYVVGFRERYADACTGNRRSKFLVGYRPGLELRRVDSAHHSAQSRLNRIEYLGREVAKRQADYNKAVADNEHPDKIAKRLEEYHEAIRRDADASAEIPKLQVQLLHALQNCTEVARKHREAGWPPVNSCS